MSNTANELTQKAKDLFMQETKDLLAFTRAGSNDCFRRVAALLALDSEAQSDCLLYADILNQKGHAGEQARDDFRNEMFVAISKAFLKILRNGAIEFVGKLTPEAQEQLENVEIWAGERAPHPVEAPAPPPKSAQEQLEDQVREDWHRLETSKMRAKINNPAYRAVVDKLMADGSLESQITTLTDGSAGGFQR
jgi:hypothetical protein